jgi:hypothetical protein
MPYSLTALEDSQINDWCKICLPNLSYQLVAFISTGPARAKSFGRAPYHGAPPPVAWPPRHARGTARFRAATVSGGPAATTRQTVTGFAARAAITG